jgi:hypothetical protein
VPGVRAWLSKPVDDKQILERIDALVAEEHQLRTNRMQGAVDVDTEAERLRHLEETLDQCWDLLRRRRALKAAGEDPNAAEPASTSQVEGYLQ